MNIQSNILFRFIKKIPIIITCFLTYLVIGIISGLLYSHNENNNHLSFEIGGDLYLSILTWILFYVFLFLFFKFSHKSQKLNKNLWIYVMFFTPSFVAVGEALESGYYPYLFFIPYGIELFTKITIGFQHWIGNWDHRSLGDLLRYPNIIIGLELLSLTTISIVYYRIIKRKAEGLKLFIQSITQNVKLIKITIYFMVLSCFLIFFWDYYISTDYCNQFEYSCEYYLIRSSQYIYSVTWIIFSLLLLLFFKAKIKTRTDYGLLIFCLIFFTPTIVSLDVEFQNVYYEPNAFIKPYGVQLISKIIQGFHITTLKGYSDLHSLFKHAAKSVTARVELVNLFLTPCVYGYIIYRKIKKGSFSNELQK